MDSNLSDKEWLDLGWKYFQQHAQQRIIYFNYFVIFSTILTTGLVATFQANFQAPYLGIGIGLIQTFLSFVFWKIDDRNKFLTKHAENIIKKIESNAGESKYKIFSEEEIETVKLKNLDKSVFFLNRQISHGGSYRIIFGAFFFIGIVGSIISLRYPLGTPNKFAPEKHHVLASVNIKIDQTEAQEKQIATRDSLLNSICTEIQQLYAKTDSIQRAISTPNPNPSKK